MIRIAVCLSVLFSMLEAGSASAQDADLIRAGVEQAREQYNSTVDRLSSQFIDELDRIIESARSKVGQQPNATKVMERLRAAQDRFKATGILPPPDLVTKPAEEFERELKKAKEALEADYNKAIAAATRQKHDALASTLKSQKEQFERDFERAHPPRVMARWLHVVGRKDRYIFEFASDGRVLSPTPGERTWEMNGNLLLLKTKAPRAPGGYWVDRCVMSADGQGYTGRNQDKTEIQGTKLPID